MIKVLENNKLDLNSLELGDIIDLKLLQKFQDDFAISMNCASVTVDINGNPVTKPSSYTRYCSNFVQKNSTGSDRCAASHKRMGDEAIRLGKPYIGRCHSGLIDFAAPITVDGVILGTILGGQVLTDTPDENDTLKLANELNVDGNGMVSAINEIDIVSTKKIEAAANVLSLVINNLAINGFNSLSLHLATKKLSNNFMQTSATLEELSASAANIAQEQESLNDEISEIRTIAKEINKILDAIKSIASQTNMLGLNASIEAARAGEAGKGFSVVAAEIKKLSDNSKQTADGISKLTTEIEKSVNKTLANSQTTLVTSQEQSKAMEDVSSSIQEAVILTENLGNMIK